MSIREPDRPTKCTVRTGEVELQSDLGNRTPAESVRGNGEYFFSHKIRSDYEQLVVEVAHLCKEVGFIRV